MPETQALRQHSQARRSHVWSRRRTICKGRVDSEAHRDVRGGEDPEQGRGSGGAGPFLGRGHGCSLLRRAHTTPAIRAKLNMNVEPEVAGAQG